MCCLHIVILQIVCTWERSDGTYVHRQNHHSRRPSSRIHINAPKHQPTQTLPIRPARLERDGIRVVVADPLPGVPGDAVLHCGLIERDDRPRARDGVRVDLVQRQHAAGVLGAGAGVAGAGGGAADSVAGGGGEGVAAAVVGDAEVEFGGGGRVGPEREEGCRDVGDGGRVGDGGLGGAAVDRPPVDVVGHEVEEGYVLLHACGVEADDRAEVGGERGGDPVGCAEGRGHLLHETD